MNKLKSIIKNILKMFYGYRAVKGLSQLRATDIIAANNIADAINDAIRVGIIIDADQCYCH